MSVVTVCRVCLRNNLNLYGVRNDLQNAFEKITRQKYNKVGYPLSMCYICLTVLRKCHRFMETARDTNNVLKQWYKQQNKMEVAQPLYIYSVSKLEVVSMANKDVPLPQDIKTEEVDLQPDYIDYDNGMDDHILHEEVTETDEQTDNKELSVDSPKDSTYSDVGQDNNDRETDQLTFDSNMDIEETSSSASNIDVHNNVEARLEVISACDDGAPPVKKRKTKETKRQRHQAPETSGETAGNNGTANDITPLSASPSRPGIIIHRETKIKLTFDNKRNNNKQSPNLNKTLKANNAILKKTKECICNVCNYKTSYKSKLISHLRTHTGETPFTCNICSYKSAHKGNLTRHLKTHTGEKPFTCNICSYESTQKDHLKRHFMTHTGEKPFNCNICSYKCALKSQLKSHLRTHTGEKPFFCDICSYKCAVKSQLKSHLRTHTGEKPFFCDICSYKCAAKSHLIRHLMTHTGEKPFTCDICSYKCVRKGDLETHLRTHTGEKPFTCNICSYESVKKDYLKRHLMTHTGEKPFFCNICSYKCAFKSQLKTHLRKHTGENPFACDICSYKCAFKGQFKTHLMTHTGEKPFTCNICSYKCARKVDLKTHLRTHTGEKPFSCDICSYKCAVKSHLTRHLKTHTGEKPFSCDICDCKFVQRQHLKRHFLSKHLTNK